LEAAAGQPFRPRVLSLAQERAYTPFRVRYRGLRAAGATTW
jgi:hypothetical protein